eukprot:jgi/Orpsp1_1/1186943/evm.model.d7180000054295.1
MNRINDNNLKFKTILNSSIINKYNLNLLSLICANQLGIIIEFILKSIKLVDILNEQDDDGNTPIHLLYKNIDNLIRYDAKYGNNYYNTFLYQNTTDHSNKYNDISSKPQLYKIFDIINEITYYIDFSIKNKDGKIPDELTNNILCQNYYCLNLINTKNEKNSSIYTYNFYNAYNNTLLSEWKTFLSLKASKRKNKTLMHFLCDGDRLGAIQFLVEHGADINKKIVNNFDITIFDGMKVKGSTPLNFLFSTFKGYYHAPSGFYYKNDFDYDLVLNNPQKFIENLNNSEKYILDETERIIEYFVCQGVDISLEENPSFRFCGISNIMYKLLKRKRDDDNSNIDNEKLKKSKIFEPTEKLIKTKKIKNENYNYNNQSCNSDYGVFREEEEEEIRDLSKLEPSSIKENQSIKNKFESQDICINDDENYSLKNINPVKAQINLPVHLWEDIKELSILTGKSVDTVCRETFTPVIKEKLKMARGFNNKNNNNNNKKLISLNKNSQNNIPSFNIYFPSDEKIDESIKEIIDNGNLSNLNIKKIRNQLSEKFNVNLSSKKKFIKECVDKYLANS